LQYLILRFSRNVRDNATFWTGFQNCIKPVAIIGEGGKELAQKPWLNERLQWISAPEKMTKPFLS